MDTKKQIAYGTCMPPVCAGCSDHTPHAPHIVDHYPTVRHGMGARVCLGRGSLAGRIIERGDALTFGRFDMTPGSGAGDRGRLAVGDRVRGVTHPSERGMPLDPVPFDGHICEARQCNEYIIVRDDGSLLSVWGTDIQIS